jgi:hypothetical protein
MNPQLLPATARDDVSAWQQTVVAFLAEKEAARAPAERSRAMPGCSGPFSIGSARRTR